MMDIDGLKRWMKRGTGSKHEYAFQLDKSLDEITRLRAENERLREALTDIADGMGETDLKDIGRFAPAVARAALHEGRQDADG